MRIEIHRNGGILSSVEVDASLSGELLGFSEKEHKARKRIVAHHVEKVKRHTLKVLKSLEGVEIYIVYSPIIKEEENGRFTNIHSHSRQE
jgi:hypothetical protein